MIGFLLGLAEYVMVVLVAGAIFFCCRRTYYTQAD